MVVDVRAVGEWDGTHIEGAINLPLSQLTDRLGELPPDRDVVVYCAGGYRSAIAASVLRRAGLGRVADLVGGIGAWQSARLETVG